MRNPPFRAEHVGSLLRPQRLLDARKQFQSQEIDAAALRKVEDECISEAVRFQEDVGLQSITDGEYRRTFFHLDFLEKLEGVHIADGATAKFRSKQGEVDFAPPKMTVTGKLKHRQNIQVDDFNYLKYCTSQTPKVCIPSPTMVHFRGGRAGVDKDAYPDMQGFFDDLATCYRAELEALSDAGCRYVQMDDTNLAYLCDPAMRQGAKDRGDDPDELPRTYAKLINECIKDRPDDMTIGIHLCRGNFQSAWAAEGGYDPVAEVMFNETKVDVFFLEYDDDRSGDFTPLRFVPKNTNVVLGIITSKVGDLEETAAVKKRIDEAAKYCDLDQLALSPQCGFSSTVHGNAITTDDQRSKLKLVVDIANDVWG